jgi:hypothetical protein
VTPPAYLKRVLTTVFLIASISFGNTACMQLGIVDAWVAADKAQNRLTTGGRYLSTPPAQLLYVAINNYFAWPLAISQHRIRETYSAESA